MTFIKKYWPSILPAIVALWGVYGTQIKDFISVHPVVMLVVSTLYTIFAHLMPSPVQPPATSVVAPKVVK